MPDRPRLLEVALERQKIRGAGYVPKFVVHVEPWPKLFVQDLAAFLSAVFKPVRAPGFWPGVFVNSAIPWSRFALSLLVHIAVVAAICEFTQIWPQQTVIHESSMPKAQVIYYEPAEYLAPLNTSEGRASKEKGDPVYASQPIISVPPDSDNRTQTVVTPAPPKLKPARDISLPNIVAWSRPVPQVPIASTLATRRTESLSTPVIAPAPQVNAEIARAARTDLATVVAPPPEVQPAALRRNLSVTQGSVIEPTPQLPTSVRRNGDLVLTASAVAPPPDLPSSQGFIRQGESTTDPEPAIVPPPPSTQLNGDERLIALGIHPANVRGPIEAPAGNRRGTFAATPQGRASASGTPDFSGTKIEAGSGQNGTSQGIPSGLFVGTAGTNAASGTANNRLVANAAVPTIGATPRPVASAVLSDNATETERKVFGERKFYSLTLNMPNLNSSSGSWVIHFAELNNNGNQGNLSAPSALQEVDPGYPLELMRHNVHGNVTLYAVIHADGSVGAVRVLNSVDERLDQYACDALSHWRFTPAIKDGNPVALEAVVVIPFRPLKTRSGF